MSQLVNADDTSVIIKTATYTILKAKEIISLPDHVMSNNYNSCTIKMIVNLFPTH